MRKGTRVSSAALWMTSVVHLGCRSHWQSTAGAVGGRPGDGTSDRLYDGRRIVSELRQYKESVEIEIMVRNARAVRDALDAARHQLHAGVTELEILGRHRVEFRSNNPTSLQLYGNCASGPRTVEPDPHASLRVINEHEPLLLDVYPRMDGYFADLTRTWCCGAATRELGRMIEAVGETLTQTAAIGLTGSKWRRARSRGKGASASRGYPDAYTHHTGHGMYRVKQQERPWMRVPDRRT